MFCKFQSWITSRVLYLKSFTMEIDLCVKSDERFPAKLPRTRQSFSPAGVGFIDFKHPNLRPKVTEFHTTHYIYR